MSQTYVLLWILWFAAFVGIETFAVTNGEPGDTLSELVWSITRHHPLLWWLLGGFLSWLALHFLGRGRWG